MRAQLRAHDGWTREEVLAYQTRRLADLRTFAIERSPFYPDLHRGLERAPEEVLSLDGVTVHPNVFHGAPERLPVAGWQVIDEGDRLRVLLAGAASIDAASTAETVKRALETVGVHDFPVVVDLVDAIPRTALGKAPLIRRAQLATAGH